jgi:uncharacterized protein (TIRG00374 family)
MAEDSNREEMAQRSRLSMRGRTWLGVLFGMACLALALYDIDLDQVAASLRATSLAWVAVAVLLVFVTVVFKALRWRYLLRADNTPSQTARELSIRRLTSIWLSGVTLNLALPAPRSGDLARAYLAGEAGHSSKSLVLGTVAAEKLLDMVMLALCLLVLVPFVAMPVELAARRVPIVGSTVALIAAVLVVLWQRYRLLAWFQWGLDRVPFRWSLPLRGSAERAVQGLDALRRPRLLVAVAILSVLIWFLATAVNYVVFLALDLPPSWAQSLFVLVVLQAGVILPSTPGKVGVFQVLCRWALGVFGYPPAIGLAYGIVLYLVAPVSQMIVGALALFWESWQLRQAPVAVPSLWSYREEAPRDPVGGPP